jgi:hypothetical protein
MVGASFSGRKQEKESVMHSPTLAGRPLASHHNGHRLHHSPLRDLHAHLRGWARPENLVASCSLGLLVLTVLALLFQAV